MIAVRPAETRDIEAMQAVISDTGLFPPDMLPEMMQAEEDALWRVAEAKGRVIGLSFARPEPLAEGCWNMLALGVLSSARRTGAGRALTQALEAELRASAVRLVIVDTSGTAEFAAARAFYEKAGYAREAVIRDYWAAGDDKVTFRKAL